MPPAGYRGEAAKGAEPNGWVGPPLGLKLPHRLPLVLLRLQTWLPAPDSNVSEVDAAALRGVFTVADASAPTNGTTARLAAGGFKRLDGWDVKVRALQWRWLARGGSRAGGRNTAWGDRARAARGAPRCAPHIVLYGAPVLTCLQYWRLAHVQVGIVDTGVDYRHPALGGGFGPGFKVAYGRDFAGDAFKPGGVPAPDADPVRGAFMPGGAHCAWLTRV